jgi:hypothetical protein
MVSEQKINDNRTPQIALVGTTRAGKSVFTTMLAKYLERKHEGVRLSPKGGTPKSTYAQIDEWWTTLQTGSWLPATPPGTLIELQWDLCLDDKKIPLRMFDYAGETLTDLFSGKKNDAVGAAKEFFDRVRAVFESASVLLVLINLESFIEKDVSSAGEHKGTLVTAMSTFLEKLKQEDRSCRVCFVFTAYDQYKPLILSKWGSVDEFLEREIPPLYYEFVDEKSDVKVIPVAAVGETEARVDPHDGRAVRFPKPGFKPVGFEPLVKWIAEAVGSAKDELDGKAIEQEQDEQNAYFIERLEQESRLLANIDQLSAIDRFLSTASNFPYKERPSAILLESKRQYFVDMAKDRRALLVDKTRAEATETRWRFLKALAAIVTFLTVGSVGISLIRAVQESYATQPCNACSAKGEVKCSVCSNGKVASGCFKCGGDGIVGEGWDDGIWQSTCPSCNGNGSGICQSCRGTGKIQCSTCKGAKNVYKYRVEK